MSPSNVTSLLLKLARLEPEKERAKSLRALALQALHVDWPVDRDPPDEPVSIDHVEEPPTEVEISDQDEAWFPTNRQTPSRIPTHPVLMTPQRERPR